MGSVIISYLLKAFFSYIHIYVMVNKKFVWSERVLILSVAAILLSVIFAIISELKFVNRLFLKINHKSIHDDIWQDVMDYKRGTTLRMICDDGIYTGILEGHEEKGNESWFILKEYSVEEEKYEYESKDIPWNSFLAVNLKNVKRIELLYGKENKPKIKIFIEKIYNKIIRK